MLSSPNRRRPASLLNTSDTRAHSEEMATWATGQAYVVWSSSVCCSIGSR